MIIDFKPVRAGEMKLAEYAQQLSRDDLRTATNESVDYLLNLISDLTDNDIVFTPEDPNASDPYAIKGEEGISWNLAHLIAHVTASSEEGAAISSLLARGIVPSERPRYETPWREITELAQCVQRLEESRRMRLAYLDTWPDTPHLDLHRYLPERLEERVGKLNAKGSLLFGLSHEIDHYAQIEEAKRQAVAARG